jgi:crossover junction endodeoxyribonuclease RusA
MSDSPLMTLRFTMPWPPSSNTYYRHIILGGKFKKARAHTLLSESGREYRIAALAAVRQQRVPLEAVSGRLAIEVVAYPPDRRRRDLSNMWKGMLDSLVHAHVIADDGDTDYESIRRGPVRPGGLLELTVRELGTVVCVQPTLDLPMPQAAANPF